MGLPSRINDLIQHFTQHIDSFKGNNYNETRARIEFIDPFFKELGWDIENTRGAAEAYKDVIHEDAVKVAGSLKAPDYSFRIGGQRKFFLEAKKPAVNIKDDISPAYQLRRYAWSAGLPVSILTDFEEFAVYDTSIQPKPNDKASTARIFYCTFEEYEKHWDFISSTFSKEAIDKGRFDNFIKDPKKKKGTTAVDKEFLKEMEKWRADLAKNIALRNNVEIHALNYVVQATIDRILFLRICEAREIEEDGQLRKISEKSDIYKNLKDLFIKADEKYNSGLFHFHKEKENRSEPDEISLRLKIDDKILKEIITALYYPSPYEFSVISADILGNVYEQFLGKVIRLTAGGQAKVEEKPEVKKAGGVYYTPQYIVRYIVENTVGELLRNKTPMMIAGKLKGHTALRILDPACGSGSFLIYAYQYLLDWHRDWYEKDIKQKGDSQAKKWSNEVYQGPGNHWYLTTREKKSILLNNIFGVDIDHQAVEVTKLNLLLKVLESENRETLGTNLRLFQERALPDLSLNIKCGNSLIGNDFYALTSNPSSAGKGDQQNLFEMDDEEKYKINAFDWDQEFSDVFREGGFNVVIGNPPYVFGGNYGIEDLEKAYFRKKYRSGTDKTNLFTLLIEKSLQILAKNSYLSFIIPNTFLRVTSYYESRKFILENSEIVEILDLGTGVFQGATTSSIILSVKKNVPAPSNQVRIKHEILGKASHIEQGIFIENDYIFAINLNKESSSISTKLKNASVPLGELASELIFGVVITKNFDTVVATKPRPGWKKFLEGRDIGRYKINFHEKYLHYKPELLHRPRSPEIFEAPEKILIQRITGGSRPVNAAYDNQKYYNKESINNLILKNDTKYAARFILGVLNSKLVNWFYSLQFTNESTLTVNLSKEYLSKIPIPSIDFDNTEETRQHDNLVALVDQILSLSNQPNTTNLTPLQKDQLQRKIETTDHEIDRLIYQLYGLTAEEIKIVEGVA